MSYKKIAACFLAWSFHVSCMLVVPSTKNAQRMPRSSGISQKIKAFNRSISSAYNKELFSTTFHQDIVPGIMSDLEYHSNIQFISSCKHLYHTYGQGEKSTFLFTRYLNSDDCKNAMVCLGAADFNNFANLSTKNDFNQEHIKILAENPLCLQYLLKQGLSPNSITQKGELFVSCFARENVPTALKILFADKLFDFNALNHKGNTALIEAVIRCKVEEMKLLLADKRFNADGKNKAGNTALIESVEGSVWRSNYEPLKVLLAHCLLDLNLQCKDAQTALIIAADKGKVEPLRLLLADDRLDINAKDKNGNTALIKAVELTNISCLNLLLADDRLDINAKDKEGDTSLMRAVSWSRIKGLMALLKHPKIDVNVSNEDYETVLMRAVSWNKIEALAALLMHPDVDVNAKDKNGDTALMKAASAGKVEVLTVLLRSPEIDVNALNEKGETPLMVALYWNKIEAFTALLMDSRIDVKATNKKGYNILVQAAESNELEAVKVLLANDKVRNHILYESRWLAYHLARKQEIIDLLSEDMSWSEKHVAGIVEVAFPVTLMLAGGFIYNKLFPEKS